MNASGLSLFLAFAVGFGSCAFLFRKVTDRHFVGPGPSASDPLAQNIVIKHKKWALPAMIKQSGGALELNVVFDLRRGADSPAVKLVMDDQGVQQIVAAQQNRAGVIIERHPVPGPSSLRLLVLPKEGPHSGQMLVDSNLDGHMDQISTGELK
jgi:hypothetical protein